MVQKEIRRLTMKKNFSHQLTLSAAIVPLLFLAGCSSSDDDGAVSEAGNNTTTSGTMVNGVIQSDGSYDIYNANFAEVSVDCADYINVYDAMPLDIQNSLTFDADVTVTATDTDCTIVSNSIPNHDFNDDSAAFAGGAAGSTITAQENFEHTITRTPEFASEPTFITANIKNGIFLNGVRLDIISAGCYKPTDSAADANGEVGIGCTSDDSWILDPLSTESKFGADLHNAHTQPGGLYHYHGSPLAMYDLTSGSGVSPVIGFAADGFPIFGAFFEDDTGAIREAVSGYTVRTGSRGVQSDSEPNPGGDYTGRYNDDWEFTDAGDLDACNGMTVNGQYGYYVTSTYPWVIRCLMGTPSDSFAQPEAGPGGAPDGSFDQITARNAPHAH